MAVKAAAAVTASLAEANRPNELHRVEIRTRSFDVLKLRADEAPGRGQEPLLCANHSVDSLPLVRPSRPQPLRAPCISCQSRRMRKLGEDKVHVLLSLSVLAASGGILRVSALRFHTTKSHRVPQQPLLPAPHQYANPPRHHSVGLHDQLGLPPLQGSSSNKTKYLPS